MSQFDQIVAITIAERIGGPEGYKLLLASVNHPPSFFLNGASTHGAFCIRSLYKYSVSSQ